MISIDVTGRTPIYEQIYRAICGEITRGLLKENDQIPPSRTLAQQLGLNPNTVAKAYSNLERDGIIYTLAGKGSFIAAQNGKASSALTKDFEERTREALRAGVSAEALKKIIDNIKGETP
ncbi:MAG: GntR family transcriptional regulator [Bacteroides sp.]|nr:GntR family transcriptional regulator [Eubacterium sp.]MCM1417433.1 GntR family transcriptional regulator [Roseburia sp.]MCM1461613.1 GntR family transcriptional regulator [Bacteroides sp.]